MLRITNLSKSFSGDLIVSVPSLELRPGVYWIKGENGVGKTTLFKSLAGHLPCQGEIEFDDGISLHRNPVQYRERVNYGEAEPLYPGFLTSKDLIHFVGHARKSPPRQQEYLIEKFGIHTYFNKPCSTYSSGMLKKLSLTLAFLGTPNLILLDEPLITLDENAQEMMIDLLNHYIREYQAIALLSSHQLLDHKNLHITQSFYINNKTLTPLPAA